MPEPSETQALELLRESSGLSIDLEGRFLHRGEPITHQRTLEALWGSLERLPDGRYLVRIGRESGYVHIADAPYAVLGITLESGAGRLFLSDATTEPLRPETLSVDRDGVLHCLVKGDHRARFTRPAQIMLGLALVEDPVSPGRYVLVLGDRSWPLRAE